MGTKIDLTGRTVGRLLVTGEAPAYVLPSGRRQLRWHCRCDCGAATVVHANNLTAGHTQSCGCLYTQVRPFTNLRHGGKDLPEYGVYGAMLTRCTNPRSTKYPIYGGRGIEVCERWRGDFAAFIADMGPRPSPAHSIERRDNNGHYEPGNCCWATRTEQSRNRRNNRTLEAGGRSMLLVEWEAETGIDGRTIHARLKRGWPVEQALGLEPHIRTR